jgi:hypothetical protein
MPDMRECLWNDQATGVMRHADAGYDNVIACARENMLRLPENLGLSNVEKPAVICRVLQIELQSGVSRAWR